MSTLIANLKLYNPFNNRYLLFNYILLIILFFFFATKIDQHELTEAFNNNQFPLAHMFLFFVSMDLFGTITATIQMDILTKPFSSCLPDQTKTAARTLFLAGIIANLIYFFVFLLLPYPTGLKGILYLLSIPVLGFLLFFIGAFLSFYIQIERKKGLTALLANIIFLVILILISEQKSFTFDFEHFIFYSSIPLLFFVWLLLLAVWKRFLHPDFRRMLFSKDSTFNFDFSTTKATQLNERFRLRDLSTTVEKEKPIDNIFLKLIKSTPYFGIKRSVAAGIYCILDRYCTLNERFFLSSSLIKFIIPTLLLFLSGYITSAVMVRTEAFSRNIIILIILSIPCFLIIEIFSPVFHNQLLPEGRSKHFCSSIFIWLIKSLIILAWISLVILSAWGLRKYMPEFTWAGIDFEYNIPNFTIILWLLVLIPVMDLFMYYFEKPCNVLTMIFFLAILLGLSLFNSFTINPAYSFISMVLAILLANGFFIERLARHWLKKDIDLLN